MRDLISRQDALDAVNDCGICIQKILDIPSAELETFEFCSGGDNPCKEYDQEKHCCNRWTKVIRQTVEEMKSAESERHRGEWIDGMPYVNSHWKVCSECHVSAPDSCGGYNFCPHCGADMRGE